MSESVTEIPLVSEASVTSELPTTALISMGFFLLFDVALALAVSYLNS